MDVLIRALSVAFWIFMSGLVVAVAVWLVKRFLPPSAQFWLLSPFGVLIRRLAGYVRPGSRVVPRHAPEDLAQPGQRPADLG